MLAPPLPREQNPRHGSLDLCVGRDVRPAAFGPISYLRYLGSRPRRIGRARGGVWTPAACRCCSRSCASIV
jgi:hypothetical protein